MPPVELVLSKLPGAKPSGRGWSAPCPAHYDRRASLSVTEGEDGRALVRCHAGCPFEKIVAAVGLTARDLMPDRDDPPSAKPARPKSRGRTFPTANAAVQALEAKLGLRSGKWVYHDAAGNPVGLVVRWDRPDGSKEIRPVSRHGDGWAIGAMPAPQPLYGLPDLPASAQVVVTEGEKAADAARPLGFVATTSAGGANAADKTDWSPLAGKNVVILPDNDDPGRKYADTVAGILAALDPPARVKVVELPGLPVGGDIVEWIAAHGDAVEPDGMRDELLALIARAETFDPSAGTTRGASGGRPAACRTCVVPDLVCFADVKPVAVPWLWPGRVPLGRITLLSGRPGAGKSFLTCDVAARISTGGDWPDGGPAPRGDTLLICAEDDPADTIAPRLIAAGANTKRVHLLTAAKLVQADGEEKIVAFDLGNVELIRDALARLLGCKLVVIDPIGSYLGGRTDTHRDNEVRAVLAPMAALAAEAGVAVVLVCHTRKAAADFADDTVLGSRAFTGLARSVLHLSADPDDRDRKRLLPGKINVGSAAPGLAFRITGSPPRVEWEEFPLDGMHADDAMASVGGGVKRHGPPPTARTAAERWLTELLADGPVLKEEVKKHADDAGLSWATVRRAQQTIGIKPRKQQFSGKWVWELPSAPGGRSCSRPADGGRSCSSSEQPEHFRGTPGESRDTSPMNGEDAQVSDNLSKLAPTVGDLSKLSDLPARRPADERWSEGVV